MRDLEVKQLIKELEITKKRWVNENVDIKRTKTN